MREKIATALHTLAYWIERERVDYSEPDVEDMELWDYGAEDRSPEHFKDSSLFGRLMK